MSVITGEISGLKGKAAARQKPKASQTENPPTQNQDNGPSFAERAVEGIRTFGRLAARGTDAAFGTDPTASTILSVQTLNGVFAGSGVIPGAVTDLFSKHFFPAYTLFAAPLFDSLKLVNDWKVNKALAKLNPAKAGTKNSFLKKLTDPNLLIDAAHVAVDVGVVVAIVGAMLHFPFLAAIPKVAALATAYGVDLVAGTLHGVTAAADGATGTAAGPNTPLTPAERAKAWRAKYSFSSMLRRVFKGEEPLDEIVPKKEEPQGKK